MKQINNIFYNFIFAYIILILIPLITGIFLNNKIVNEYEDHVKKSYLSQLIKTEEILESFVDDIKWSTYQIGNNTKLLRLLSDENKKLTNMERSLLLRETMSELRVSLLYNTSFNSTFYIYLKDQDIIITPYSIYSHDDFNNSFNFFKMENIESNEWHSYLSTKYISGKILKVRNTIIEDFKNKKMIPYVQSLPIDNKKSKDVVQGAIVYLIGEADFIRFLDYKSIPKGGYSYIADDQNNIISSVTNTEMSIEPIELEGNEGFINKKIDNKKMFIIYTTSAKNKWKYVSVLPEEWVVKRVSFYQILSIMVMSLALIISLFLAYKLSQRWSKPITSSINSLEKFLKTETKHDQSFKTLDDHINEIIYKSEHLQNELLIQKAFFNNALVSRLVNGFFKDENGLNSYLKHLGFNFTENYFSVAVLSIVGFETEGSPESFDYLISLKNSIKSSFYSDFPMKLMISEQENNDLVFIILTNININFSEILIESFYSFFNEIPENIKNHIIIGLGDQVDSLMNINRSYIQALDILSMNKNDSGLLILDKNSVEKKIEDFYYPIEIETRLINSIKSGNLENTQSIIDQLYRENLTVRNLEKSKVQLLYSNLENTVKRVLDQIKDSTKEQIDLSLTPEDDCNFDKIKDLFKSICALQNSNKKSHNNLLSDKVKDFLQKNYQDKNISLSSVADTFSITESYLSFFFKEQTGVNFSSYLETIRVSEAKRLLLSTNETIQYIAYNIGYNSDKTFRRVFQKSMNISPSEFRANNQKS